MRAFLRSRRDDRSPSSSESRSRRKRKSYRRSEKSKSKRSRRDRERRRRERSPSSSSSESDSRSRRRSSKEESKKEGGEKRASQPKRSRWSTVENKNPTKPTPPASAPLLGPSINPALGISTITQSWLYYVGYYLFFPTNDVTTTRKSSGHESDEPRPHEPARRCKPNGNATGTTKRSQAFADSTGGPSSYVRILGHTHNVAKRSQTCQPVRANRWHHPIFKSHVFLCCNSGSASQPYGVPRGGRTDPTAGSAAKDHSATGQ
eukprot:1380539-Amorphochlora_amoeboformis.AAC.2